MVSGQLSGTTIIIFGGLTVEYIRFADTRKLTGSTKSYDIYVSGQLPPAVEKFTTRFQRNGLKIYTAGDANQGCDLGKFQFNSFLLSGGIFLTDFI